MCQPPSQCSGLWGVGILGEKEANWCPLTRRVEPVDAKHGLAVEHPEVAVVAGQQAGLAGTDDVVANNIPTGKREGKRVSLGKRWLFQLQLNSPRCQSIM